MNIIETAGLGKRYRRNWALRDCDLTIPGGQVVALVGPNGAGKTTMLHMAVGLTRPTAGTVTVLGGEPAGSPGALDRIAFVAQDAPLYKNLPVAGMLRVAGDLNRRWDSRRAEARLAELGIPLDQKVGKLSGGQKAQLALTVALARQPDLLVLDEPLAMLDPLARYEFLQSVMAAAATDGVSVVLSSHALAELERVADYLIVLSRAHVQVAGEVAEVIAGHRVLTGPAAEVDRHAERLRIVHRSRDGALAQLLVRTATPADPVPGGCQARAASLEEIVLAYLRDPGASALGGAAAPGDAVPLARPAAHGTETRP